MCDSYGGGGLERKSASCAHITSTQNRGRKHEWSVRIASGGMRKGADAESIELTDGTVPVRCVCAISAPRSGLEAYVCACPRAPLMQPKIPVLDNIHNCDTHHADTSAPHSRKGCMGAGKSRERRTILDGDAGGCVPLLLLPDPSKRVSSGISTLAITCLPPITSAPNHLYTQLQWGVFV
jgi:hypothetical protein